MGLLGGATSLVELIMKKFGDDTASAAKELERLGGFPESVAGRIATGELPMDEASRLQRASEQGYDTSRPVYHGTDTDFLEFDPERAVGTQFWSTTDKGAVEGREVGAAGHGVIKELYHGIQNPAGWEEYDKLLLDEISGRGYDGLKLSDPDGHATMVAFDPKQYKSTDAAFDPQYKGPNIMGGAAGTAGLAGLLAAGQSEDSEAGPLSKAAKKLADEWDEAAWLKENPRPEGTARENPAVKTWMNKRSEAKSAANGVEPYHVRNKEKMKEYADSNKERRAETVRAWAERNAEKRQSYMRKWKEENKSSVRAYDASRRASKIDQTPKMANSEAIENIYSQASLLSEATGTPYHVDHVLPLQGEDVRGLHTQGNLMIVPGSLNQSKTNKFNPGDDPMKFNDQALKNIREQNEKGLLGGFADPTLLAGTAAGTAAGLIAAPMVKDSGMISSPRSETLFDLTMGARDVERRLEGNPASLLFPSGLVDYLETVNRREEKPNATTRGMALLDVLPF